MRMTKKQNKDFHSENFIKNLLRRADIEINGSRPWDIRIYSAQVYDQVLSRLNLGLGETYMDGLWDCQELDQFFERVLAAKLDREITSAKLLMHHIRVKLLNLQTKPRAWKVGKQHYDLGNDFYEAMLDSRMNYSCGYWRNADTLEQAQIDKLDLICRKLKLKPGMRVLDIGCGWGSFMAYAVENYGVKCTGVTISKEQAQYAKEKYPHLNLEFRLQDYREIDEEFDRIVSIGMFEHVGRKNFRQYMLMAK